MNPALQNRLVGTIILVALAIIFLPNIFDGEKQTNDNAFVTLPQSPTMEDVPNIAPFPTDDVKQKAVRSIEIIDEEPVDDVFTQTATDESDNQDTLDIAEQNEAEEAAQETSNTSATQNPGWVIQLGSFRHQKNVRDLLNKLEKAGYRAYSKPVQTRSGELTKVFVGPDLEKETLQKAVPHLRELTKLKGKVTPFSVQ